MSEPTKLHPLWRVTRNCYQHSPDTAHVDAYLWSEELPSSPELTANVFTSLPKDARLCEDGDNRGMICAYWTEPSTADDRARLTAELEAQAERREFEAWKRARATGAEP